MTLSRREILFHCCVSNTYPTKSRQVRNECYVRYDRTNTSKYIYVGITIVEKRGTTYLHEYRRFFDQIRVITAEAARRGPR